MFSIVFPGQGSQVVGMSNQFYNKFDLFKRIYKEADEILDYPLSKIILEGPEKELNLTENTQPAIFLVGYTIFHLMKQEFDINLHNAKYFAGHSLGEYTALACSNVLSFEDTIKILKIRGKAMQDAVPKGQGGMLAVLGSETKIIEKIIEDNKKIFKCFIANDNSIGQIVVSGILSDINKFSEVLTSKKIKSVKLSVSAPFHCELMNKATNIMEKEIKNISFNDFKNQIISNVTASAISDKKLIPDLLIANIEKRVRWRESIEYMIKNNISTFIEIGPGKVLSGLIKRINRTVKVSAINNEGDINNLNLND